MIGYRVFLKSRCTQRDTHRCDMEKAVIGETTFSGGSGNESYCKPSLQESLSVFGLHRTAFALQKRLLRRIIKLSSKTFLRPSRDHGQLPVFPNQRRRSKSLCVTHFQAM